MNRRSETDATEPSELGSRLTREVYARPTLDVAPDLLGCWLVHDLPDGRRAGRIVEVEAYVGTDDLASHASRGRTPRASIMYGPPGFGYVFLIYGMHHCFNVVTDAEDVAGAVLIRAVEPGEGVSGATDGPGRVCRALGIDRSATGHDLTSAPLWLERRPGPPPGPIATSPRIGVEYAGAWASRPWRFYLPASRHVSRRPRSPASPVADGGSP